MIVQHDSATHLNLLTTHIQQQLYVIHPASTMECVRDLVYAGAQKTGKGCSVNKVY